MGSIFRRLKSFFFCLWLCAAFFSACSARHPSLLSEPEPDEKESPEAKANLDLFRELVRTVRKYHVFAEQTDLNLGFSWEKALPMLEEEFSDARTDGLLMKALWHFGNNLHNPHVRYHTPEPSQWLTVGFKIDVEWRDGRPQFYASHVTAKALQNTIKPGDLLVEMDGVPSGLFLEMFHLKSNGNNWRSIALDIAQFAWKRRAQVHGLVPGESGEWVFLDRQTNQKKRIEATWHRFNTSGRPPEGDFAIDYSADEIVDYGPYHREFMGYNFEIYTSGQRPYSEYPIVRFFSFRYGGRKWRRLMKMDHQNLKTQLGNMPSIKGIILDLRDNHGGNNPNWFLDWFAPAPYYDHFVFTRLHDDFQDRNKLRAARITGWDQGKRERYLAALKNKTAEQEFWGPEPFFCPASDCTDWDNQYTPKNQVTNQRLALLVGPGCISSCDHFSFIFKENGFGPLIGTSGSSGYTVYRFMHPVHHPHHGADLGIFQFAFSYEISGKTRRPVEAVPVPPDYSIEPTFENRSSYDRLLVQTAITAFEEFKFQQ